jgi:cold shock protein
MGIRAAAMSDTATKTGTIKWFDSHKGYGFIVPAAGGADLFVHMSEIANEYYCPSQGAKVTYVEDKGRGDGKPCARRVVVRRGI